MPHAYRSKPKARKQATIENGNSPTLVVFTSRRTRQHGHGMHITPGEKVKVCASFYIRPDQFQMFYEPVDSMRPRSDSINTTHKPHLTLQELMMTAAAGVWALSEPHR